jgi:benzoate 4-monooxygenase
MALLQILLLLAVTSSILLTLRLYRNTQKLRGFPGPFIASLTDVWFFWQQWSGKSWFEITGNLHEKYGPVVRLGPHRLSFGDPVAIEAIYGFHPLLVKVGRVL